MGDHQSGLQVSRILDTTSSPRGLERTKSGEGVLYEAGGHVGDP